MGVGSRPVIPMFRPPDTTSVAGVPHEEISIRHRLGTWVHQHQRAGGIGLTLAAFALLGIAVLIGSAIVTGLPPPIANVGPSSTPELSPSVEPTQAATATPAYP